MKTAHEVYLETHAKVNSGEKITRNDFGEVGANGWVEYDERTKAAITLGAEDAKNNIPPRTQPQLDEKLIELLR